jgi:nucleoside-diphosphate-sugar epimerase
MSDCIPSLNCVILGATGRVGRLLTAAFGHSADKTLRLWPQTRAVTLGELQHLRDHCGSVDCFFVLSGVTPTSTGTDMGLNISLAIAALNQAAEIGVGHVFLTSSAAVYGNPAGNTPLTETGICAPNSQYGRAKIAMEQAALRWRQGYGDGAPNVTCLRIGNVTGADQLMLNARTATADAPLGLDRFTGGASARRSYIGPQTLAAVVSTLFHKAAGGTSLPDILNIASPAPVYMAALLDALGQMDRPVAWEFQTPPKTAIPTVQLDTTLLETLHQFSDRDSEPTEMIRQWLACRRAA